MNAVSRTYAVTGVATGIGQKIAGELKSNGHRVIGFDIASRAENVDRLISVDLNDEESISEAVREMDEPLDGLCNNAGIPPRPGFEEQILKVNFLGQRKFTRHLMPRLNAGASIVNMASRAGQAWRENIGQVLRLSAVRNNADLKAFIKNENIDPLRAYNLSKEAMIAWTQAESEAMIASGMRMNSISPGAIATGILDDFAKAFGEAMAKNVKRAGRPGNPEEIAALAVFLLSPKSNWLKGTDIPIDGGMGSFAVCDTLNLQEMRMAG